MLPRTTTPLAFEPDDTADSPDSRPARARILSAAMALVHQQGMQALTQARVADDAGLRQSHLTYYFPTRNELIKAVVELAHTEVMQYISPPARGERRSGPTRSDVREFIAARVADPLMARLMLALTAAADEEPSLRRWLVKLEKNMLVQLRGVFIALGLAPSDDELRLFHASMVGAAILGAQQSTLASAARAGRVVRLAYDRLVAAAPPVPLPKTRKAGH